MFKDNFSRYEFKFPMTYGDVDQLVDDLRPFVAPDEHVDENGLYTISSLYMDNPQLQCYYETINGDAIRQKVRLRVYGEKNGPDAPSFLEIKGKVSGLVVKRRVRMVLSDAMAFVKDCTAYGYDFDISKYKSTNPQILKELQRVIVSNRLDFVNVVSYERLPFFCVQDPDLRITFDFDIRTRGDELDLTKGTRGNRTCPEGVSILEVKTSKAIPFWLVKILSTYGYRNQTFSKYCSHYSPQNVMLAGPESGNIHANNTLIDHSKGEYKNVPGILYITD